MVPAGPFLDGSAEEEEEDGLGDGGVDVDEACIGRGRGPALEALVETIFRLELTAAASAVVLKTLALVLLALQLLPLLLLRRMGARGPEMRTVVVIRAVLRVVVDLNLFWVLVGSRKEEEEEEEVAVGEDLEGAEAVPPAISRACWLVTGIFADVRCLGVACVCTTFFFLEGFQKLEKDSAAVLIS